MFYFKRVLPLIGSLVSRHSTAYSYLPASVLEFPEPPVLATIMEAAGLVDVKWQTLTGGIVAIHSGLKGPSGNEDRERQSRENSLERGAISDFTG
jgi:demethylmenaquinone methyltransferase/2-methoxy-6-polyprenyl-1,4-benzoquinol methylase